MICLPGTDPMLCSYQGQGAHRGHGVRCLNWWSGNNGGRATMAAARWIGPGERGLFVAGGEAGCADARCDDSRWEGRWRGGG
eukprot:2521198-Rhodomonas_salina.1